MSARPIRLTALILLLVWPVSACTSWRSLPSLQTGLGESVERVRVLTPTGRDLVVWHPKVRGDSLFGASARDRKDSADVRLGNLQTLQIRRFSAGRTILLVTVVGVGVVVVTGAIVAASMGDMGMDWGGTSWGCGSCN